MLMDQVFNDGSMCYKISWKDLDIILFKLDEVQACKLNWVRKIFFFFSIVDMLGRGSSNNIGTTQGRFSFYKNNK